MAREIKQTYEINAPIDKVWETLTEIERYKDWNPFVVEAHCRSSARSLGAVMKLRVEWSGGGGARSTEEVIEVIAPSQDSGQLSASWVYSLRGWMHAIGMVRSLRAQRLRQVPGGPTLYESEISLTGWGAGGAPLAKVREGMSAQAEALKRYVEGGPSVKDSP